MNIKIKKTMIAAVSAALLLPAFSAFSLAGSVSGAAGTAGAEISANAYDEDATIGPDAVLSFNGASVSYDGNGNIIENSAETPENTVDDASEDGAAEAGNAILGLSAPEDEYPDEWNEGFAEDADGAVAGSVLAAKEANETEAADTADETDGTDIGAEISAIDGSDEYATPRKGNTAMTIVSVAALLLAAGIPAGIIIGKTKAEKKRAQRNKDVYQSILTDDEKHDDFKDFSE